VSDFEKELIKLINRHSQENTSNTPDFILASFILRCLSAFDFAVNNRSDWYGQYREPGKAAEMAGERGLRGENT